LTKTHGLHHHLRTVFTLAVLSLGCASHAPRNESAHSNPLVAELQRKLDSLRATAALPGATFGIALRDERTIGLATGFADTSLHTMLRPSDRLMQEASERRTSPGIPVAI
jgi:hypothetical protein